MNERIKELMEEAGIYDFVVESMGINEEMEKFAELIVKECANVAADHEALDIYEEIREHFGV
jgi:hypothetical protein